MKNLSIPLTSLALAVAVASSQQQALAQSALEEVIVTAQKREQSLQEVPIAVTAINGDALKQSGVVTLSDISQSVPGLTITGTQSEGVGVSMRGIASNDFGFAVEQSIPIYLDGVYLGFGVPLVGDLKDIAQVEVLKGPQGTLFGRNAVGGAVSILTNPVADEFEGSVSANVGNYDLREVNGMINAPITDELGIRVNASKRDRDGWQTNVVTGKEDGYEQDRWMVRSKINWAPSDDLQFELTSDKKEEDDHVGYYHLVESVFPEAMFNPVVFDADGTDAANGDIPEGDEYGVNYQLEREISGHALKADWDINDSLALTSITSYRSLEYAIEEDNDGNEFLMLNVRSFGDSDEISQEFRLSGKGDSVDWFVGVNAYQQDVEGSVEDSIGPAILGFAFTEENVVESETESYGVFGDAIWAATDKLNITLGARYSYDEKTQDILTPNQNTLDLGLFDPMLAGYAVNVVFPSADQLTDAQGNLDPSLASQTEDWDNLSFRGVVDYQIDDDVMVYFSASQGYKSGGFNSFPTVDTNTFVATPGQLDPYDEETIINYELGAKTELLDGRLRINGSLFYYDWDDLQVQVAEGTALFTINAGKAVGQGVDLELAYQVSEGLSVVSNLGYLDAEFDEDVPGNFSKGEELPYSPHFAGSLALDYSHMIANSGELRANVSYNYNGDQVLASGYEDESYSLVNARVSFLTASETWELALWGRNLTDEEYIDQVSDFSEALGYVSARRNEPRTYGAEVVYNF